MGDVNFRGTWIACMPGPGGLSIPGVHESGHAVARFLTAARFGIASENAVRSIEMRLGGGTTFGPMFSAEIQQAADRVHARYTTEAATEKPTLLEALFRERPREYFTLVMTEARNSGADIVMWLEAKITQCVAGPLAEALYQKRSFAQVIKSASCRADVADIARAWSIAALVLPSLAKDGWSQRIAPSSKVLREQFSEAETWAPLLAVARALPLIGTMAGRNAWEIFSQGQQGTSWHPSSQSGS